MRSFISTALLAAAIACTLTAASSQGNSTTPRALEEMAVGTLQVCGLDIVGHDVGSISIRDPDNCMTNCHVVYEQKVNAASWIKINNVGMCYCKKVDASSHTNEYLIPKPGVASFIEGRPLKGRAEMVEDMGGHMDLPGNDIGNVRTTEGECSNACEGWDRCFAYTWTGYNGGTCWMKSKAERVLYVGEKATSGYALRPFVKGRCP